MSVGEGNRMEFCIDPEIIGGGKLTLGVRLVLKDCLYKAQHNKHVIVYLMERVGVRK